MGRGPEMTLRGARRTLSERSVCQESEVRDVFRIGPGSFDPRMDLEVEVSCELEVTRSGRTGDAAYLSEVGVAKGGCGS
jgi:hypothetical protein